MNSYKLVHSSGTFYVGFDVEDAPAGLFDAAQKSCEFLHIPLEQLRGIEGLPPLQIWREIEPPKVPIVELTVVPTSITAGETAVLTWFTEHAAEIFLNNAAVAAEGSMEVQPVESISYELVASGPGGITTDEIFLEVNPATPPPQHIVRVIDDQDPGFSTVGSWTPWSNQGYKSRIVFAAQGNGSAVATWSFEDLEPGKYRVSVTWFSYENRATDAPFTVFDKIVRINQELSPADFQENDTWWEDLGAFSVTNSLVVKLSNDANEYVIADAVRIEGPYPLDWEISGPPPPPLAPLTLTATPDQVQEGQSVTLRWNAEGANSVSLSGDLASDGSGYVYEEVAISGSKIVALSGSRAFHLKAIYPGGWVVEIPANVTVLRDLPHQHWDGVSYIDLGEGRRCPDFWTIATNETIADGQWSDPDIWSQSGIPDNGELVRIKHTVLYDVHSDEALASLEIVSGGELWFDPDNKTRLTATNVLVRQGGKLQAGEAPAPVVAWVSASLAFQDRPYHPADTEQWGNVFLCLGKIQIRGTPCDRLFLRLAREPRAGDKKLLLSEPAPEAWSAGERYLIPDSRQLQPGGSCEELVFSSGFSADRRILYLVEPLKFNHPAWHDEQGQPHLNWMPHVARLSTNVGIRSTNPLSPNRGHIWVDSRTAVVSICNAALHGLGRVQSDRHSFNVSKANSCNIVLENCSIFDPPQPQHGYNDSPIPWGITLKAPAKVKGNVVYNWAGAGVFSNWSGAEIDGNFISRIHGNGARADAGQGKSGNGIWCYPIDRVRNNVVCNVASPTNSHYGISLIGNGGDLPVAEFSGNEIYGCERGFEIWYVGTTDSQPSATRESVLDGLKIWHCSLMAIFRYPCSKVTFRGLQIRGDYSLREYSMLGVIIVDYLTHEGKIMDADIRGCSYGYGPATINKPMASNEETAEIIEDSFLQNVWNINAGPIWGVAPDFWYPSRVFHIRNCRCEAPPGQPLHTIAVNLFTREEWERREDGHILQTNECYVYDYQQQAGDDFRLYFPEQAPDWLLPTNPNIYHPPEKNVGGLTNIQAWEQHKVAACGSVAPAETETREGIIGLVAQL